MLILHASTTLKYHTRIKYYSKECIKLKILRVVDRGAILFSKINLGKKRIRHRATLSFE